MTVSPDPEALRSIEKTMLAIWHEIFQRADLDLADDFFALEGDSVLAIQLIARVQETFEVNVDMAAIFDHSTVAQLSNVVEKELTAGA
jgi:acyl carrier protein